MESVFDLKQELTQVVETFIKNNVPYALCGGLALAVHGHPRATKDLDFLVPPEHIEAAIGALHQAGFTLRAGPMPLGIKTTHPQRLFRATKVKLTQHLTVDLLEVSASYKNTWDSREKLDWRGHSMTIVSKHGLIAMKQLSTRAKDLADIETLNGLNND
jgi:hypothetical protein